MRRATYLLGLILVLIPLSQVHAQRRLKIYISVDMEGIAGVVSPDQLGPAGFEYPRFREFMTGEALAAVNAAKEAGATEVVVSDSHGNGENLLIEKFPADVRVVRSWPRPLMMMQGIDSTFDAALFIGYHSSTTNLAGVRAHTMSSARLTAIELNHISMPEAGVNAAIAGYFGVPIVFLSGDDVATAEAKALLGDLETAAVKTAISFHAATTMTPEAAQTLIGQKVKAAFARRRDFKPYVLRAPIQLDLTFKSYRPVELLGYLPFVKRTTSHTVQITGSILDISKFLEFATNYSPDLEP
jgi:D-amino peptidase